MPDYLPEYTPSPSPAKATGNGRHFAPTPPPDLAAEQQALADATAWAELETAVDAQLIRLLPLGKREYQKRRNTVMALAWAAVTPGMSINQALQQPGTVSRGIFYNAEKDWFHNALFQEVLTAVTDLVRGYEEGRARRLMEWRRRHFMEKTYQLSVLMLDEAQRMVEWPMERVVEEQEEEDEDGRTLIRRTVEPAGWNKNTASLHLMRASKVGREALGLDADDDLEDEDDGITIEYVNDWRGDNATVIPQND